MDLSTKYLGMTLRTPLVPSASPLSEEIDNIKRMEDAGAAAVILHSLFEEQLRLESYLYHIQKAKEAVSIPIIASLNGTSVGGWIDYSKRIERAGADALELNIYYIPADIEMTSAQVEAIS